MIAEALAALYDLAARCEVCGDHAATREAYQPSVGLWRVCDREHCVSKVPRSVQWRDRTHAEVLRAANAAREALAAP